MLLTFFDFLWYHMTKLFMEVIEMPKQAETKRDKFVRLAEARTNKIIDMLQLLGNCSNSSAYEYSQQDVDKIFSAIEYEVKEAKKKFSKVEGKKGSKFTLR